MTPTFLSPVKFITEFVTGLQNPREDCEKNQVYELAIPVGYFICTKQRTILIRPIEKEMI